MKKLLYYFASCLLVFPIGLGTSCSDDSKSTPEPDSGNEIIITASHALGTCVSQTEDGKKSNSFHIVLSDITIGGTAESPTFSTAGKFISIDLYTIGQEAGILAEGTYEFVNGNPTETLGGGLEHSVYGKTGDTGNIVGGTVSFSKATATVSRKGNGYKIEVAATLSNSDLVKCNYEGTIDLGETPGPSYDIDISANYALGICISQVMEDDSSNFFISLSDIEMEGDAEEPLFGEAGKYISVDLYAIEQEEGILPEGTYEFVNDEPVSGQGSLDYSIYGTTDATGAVSEPIMFSKGSIEVSHTDDGYKIEMLATLSNSRTLHCSYEGMIDFDFGTGGGEITLPGLESDINTSFITAEGKYYGTTDSGAGEYVLDLYDNTDDTRTTNRLSLTLFSEPLANGLGIKPGTYTVAPTGSAGTLFPGSLDQQTLQIIGCYAEQMFISADDYKMFYGIITTGTVTVMANASGYTFTAALADADGHSIEGSYTGTIDFVDKSYNSTLENDIEVNMADMPCEMDYFRDYFGIGGDNWTVFIGTEEDGTEALQIDLVAPTSGFDGGLPVGEYTVGDVKTYQSGDFLCVPGELAGSNLYSSWYLGDYSDGAVYSMAPFSSGKVSVSKAGKQYTITVDVYDDRESPNKITCTWTGIPTISNKAGNQNVDAIRNQIVKSASTTVAKKSLSLCKKVALHAVSPKKGAATRHGKW